MVQMKQSGRELRSTNQYLLQIPNTRLKTYGDVAFSVAGPTKWNRLPMHIRLAPTIDYFKLNFYINCCIYESMYNALEPPVGAGS